MNRRDLINLFIKKRNYKDYLEIGIAGGENFSAIICHDSLPYCENVSHFPRDKDGHWNGSVFRAYPIFKELGISFNVINTDEGLGIIEYQKINIPEIYPEESKISYYEIFGNIKTRNEYLNVISVKEAMEKFF